VCCFFEYTGAGLNIFDLDRLGSVAQYALCRSHHSARKPRVEGLTEACSGGSILHHAASAARLAKWTTYR